MTPDIPHAARRLIASADWKALRPVLQDYAGKTPAEGGAVRSCGRYDVLAYLDYLAGQADVPKVTRRRRGDAAGG